MSLTSMSLTLRDVFQALDYGTPRGGGGVTFPHVSTDTRTLQPGDLFVALTGPATDGHQFIPHALRAGAGGLVVSQPVVASLDTPVLRVPDTEVAYGLLARHWRDRFDIPVIGVTGSVGKTTVKEMLAAALSPLGPILKTAASQNNETGVPKALLQLTPDHRAAVIEMGMRGSGQIAYLCGIARPTLGVITVIADNHLEMLGSWDAIADAKGELLESLPAEGLAVLNADDPYLPRLRAKTAARIVTYGTAPTPGPSPASGRGESDKDANAGGSCSLPSVPPLPLAGEGPGVGGSWTAENIASADDGWRFTVRGVSVEIASLSRHDIGNALAALAVADALGVPLADAAHALRGYIPPPMRMEIVKTNSGVTILNDAYNAAPASVKSALETLSAYPGGRKIAFLGDMRELGARADEAHRELGEVIAELGGLDALYTVGGLAAQIPNAAQRFADSDEAARFAREALAPQPGNVILVKASRAVALEKVVAALAGEPTPLLRDKSLRTAPPEAGGEGVSEKAGVPTSSSSRSGRTPVNEVNKEVGFPSSEAEP
jgi:UDP-N-acetylmuramoyl-tripeptide--D-alanyl-D-alanine ligase